MLLYYSDTGTLRYQGLSQLAWWNNHLHCVLEPDVATLCLETSTRTEYRAVVTVFAFAISVSGSVELQLCVVKKIYNYFPHSLH